MSRNLSIFIVILAALGCVRSASLTLLEFSITSSMTQEDVRFALSRCQNDSATAGRALKALWVRRIFPDDHNTHCYIKCFVGKLGLIDLRMRGLDWQQLYATWNSVDMKSDECELCLQLSLPNQQVTDTCASYYRQWTILRTCCGDLVKTIFFENGNKTPSRYKHAPPSKGIGVTASRYCHATAAGMTAQIEAILADGAKLIANSKRTLSCVFRHIRYIDAYGRVDVSEVMQSYSESHLLTRENERIIESCTHGSNALHDDRVDSIDEMAFSLASCLYRSSRDFAQVYRNRDEATRWY